LGIAPIATGSGTFLAVDWALMTESPRRPPPGATWEWATWRRPDGALAGALGGAWRLRRRSSLTMRGIDMYRITAGMMCEHWNVVDMFGL
jgi:hypothetical protein